MAGQADASSQSGSRTYSSHIWIIDSGASLHMTNNSSQLVNISTDGLRVTLANGETAAAMGKGSLRVSPQTGIPVTLEEVLYVPSLADNLLSVRAVTRHGGSVEFIGDACAVHISARMAMMATPNSRNQYEAVMQETPAAAVAYGQASSEVARLWHRRYCHLSATNLRIVSNLVKGMAPLQATYVASSEGALCHPCIVGRMHAEPFRAKDAATGKLELVHMDLVGPLPDSLGKARHFVAVLDDATELVVVSALKAKSEAGKVVQAWIAQLELQAGARVKRVRCEGAGELISAEMRAFHARRGIRLELTAAHTPQQNVKAERLNRTLMERVRSISAEAGPCEELWAEAFMAVVYTCNRAPTSDGKATPHERFYGKTPDVACLRVWGSLAYALKPTGQQRKLQPKTLLGRMVGYVAGGQAYRVYNPASRKVVVRRNVVVDETLRARGGTSSPPFILAPDSGADSTTETDYTSNSTTETPDSSSSQLESPQSTPSEPAPVDQVPETSSSDPTRGEPNTSMFGDGRYPMRSRRPKRLFDDEQGSASQATITAFTSEALRTMPTTVKEAMARPDAHLRLEAMQDELRSLAENNAWELTDLPPGAKLTGSRWVFDLKRDAAGNVVRNKAHFVFRGFSQRPGVDYDEVWAPTPARATVRAVLALAAARNMEIHCLDIKTAYLNAIMDKDVYVEQPEGDAVGGKKLVWHILRALYGCKQASRLRGSHFATTLVNAGAVRSATDPCLFVWSHAVHGVLFILVHVDDVLLSAKDRAGIMTVKDVITSAYTIRDLGEVRDFLGLRITHDQAARTPTLASPGYARALVGAHGLGSAISAKVPMAPGVVLACTGAELQDEGGPAYAELVGGLLYLATTTRPDIAFAAGVLSRYMHAPEGGHWRAAKQVLRYLAGTLDMGLCFGGDGDLEACCDANFAADRDTRRSTTGWLLCWNGAAVSWCSRRQQTVSTSTAEAEYIAAAAVTEEALWFCKLLVDLGEPLTKIKIGEDNNACLAMVSNPEGTGRAKHIDIAHHMARDRVARREVAFYRLPTTELAADGFTKPLPVAAFAACRSCVGVRAHGNATRA